MTLLKKTVSCVDKLFVLNRSTNIHNTETWQKRTPFLQNNKQFWKTVKLWLTDKTLKDDRITLTEKEKVVSEERELVKIFSEFF